MAAQGRVTTKDCHKRRRRRAAPIMVVL